MGKLFDELKRRNVIRVAIAYVVASWVLLQVADLVLETIAAPAWVMQVFMLGLGLGFPLILVFSWAFELTPDGLKLEKDVDRSESVSHLTAQKLDRVTIGMLALVLVIFVGERLLKTGEPAAAPRPALVEATDKSIAVLAFQDLSPQGDQAYFAEGISEELLNVLAQIPDLKVAGRTSSFAFKDQQRDLREIGEILEVAHILEGSVRTSGNRVRVTAQLVKAEDGFHLFSKNYDRELDDIFAVQDEIAQEISTSLRATIMGEDTIEKAAPTEPEAYNLYLQARQFLHSRDRQLMEQASVLLDEALAIDPDYAPALAQKALSLLLLSDVDGAYGDIPREQALEMARPLLDRALALEPGSAEVHATLGLWHSNNEPVGISEAAAASLRRALEINPQHTNASNWLASEIYDPEAPDESSRLYERVAAHDPLYRPAFNNLTFAYISTRELDKADSLVGRVQRITGESPSIQFARGVIAMANGELATAYRELSEAHAFNPSASVVQLWYAAAAYYLGDFDLASDVARDTQRLIPLENAGRHAEAVELFESLRKQPLDEFHLASIGDWFLLQDRAADYIAFIEDYFKESDDWIAAIPLPEQRWGARAYTTIAHALRATGNEADTARLLDLSGRALAMQRRGRADNLFFWYNMAEAAALNGDRAGMLEHLRRAVDTGHVSVAGFDTAPFEGYRGDAAFIELENETIRRANEERRKLGLLAT